MSFLPCAFLRFPPYVCSAVVMATSSLQNFTNFLWSSVPWEEHLLATPYEQHHIKVELEFLRLRKRFLHLACERFFPVCLKTGKIFTWVYSDSKQGSEYFPPHSLAIPLMGIHFSWLFSHFGILLNVLAIYIKKTAYFRTVC